MLGKRTAYSTVGGNAKSQQCQLISCRCCVQRLVRIIVCYGSLAHGFYSVDTESDGYGERGDLKD